MLWRNIRIIFDLSGMRERCQRQMEKITEKTIISIPFLLSKSVNHLCLHAINNRDALTTIDTENLGKTVFLTREEAEAALEKMKERGK